MVGVVLLELSIFSVLQMSALTQMEIKGVHNFYATYMYINCTNLSFLNTSKCLQYSNCKMISSCECKHIKELTYTTSLDDLHIKWSRFEPYFFPFKLKLCLTKLIYMVN